MKYNILIILFCLLASISIGQNNKILIFGYVKDAESDQPIPSVQIYLESNKKIGTTTNSNGYYELSIDKSQVSIVFSHVSYEVQKYKIEKLSDQKIDVELITKYYTLGVTEIKAQASKIINDKSLYVLDYEIFGDNLMLIANYFAQKPMLLLMSVDGDTIAKTKINDTPIKLHKDCFGNIHLQTEKAIYQIFFENNVLSMQYPSTIKEFNENMLPIVAEMKGKLFYKEYFANNQVLLYYFKEKDKEDKKLALIADEKALRMLSDRNRDMAMGKNYSEADLRFEEMFFYDPIFSPLFKKNDSLIIFNFIDSEIDIYNSQCNLISITDIDFHKAKNWKEDIILDNKTGKFYSLYRKNGIARLSEIDIKTGKTGTTINIPHFYFIEKIRIHNNKIFFLDSDQRYNELQMLYIQNMN